MAQPDLDEEKIESDENSQLKVVSHPPKFTIDKLCTKIQNWDFKDLKNLDFNKLTKDEKKEIEESM